MELKYRYFSSRFLETIALIDRCRFLFRWTYCKKVLYRSKVARNPVVYVSSICALCQVWPHMIRAPTRSLWVLHCIIQQKYHNISFTVSPYLLFIVITFNDSPNSGASHPLDVCTLELGDRRISSCILHKKFYGHPTLANLTGCRVHTVYGYRLLDKLSILVVEYPSHFKPFSNFDSFVCVNPSTSRGLLAR